MPRKSAVAAVMGQPQAEELDRCDGNPKWGQEVAGIELDVLSGE